MAELSLARIGPLAGRSEKADAVLSVAPPASRFLFRGDAAAAAKAGEAFGVTLPLAACRAETRGGRAALWLGPDEWLLRAPEDEGTDIAAAIARALASTAHALVDIGHRDAGIVVSGPDGAAIVNRDCPLDLRLEAFPVGMCTRTVLAKAEIVLWREETARLRIEVARSLASYVWDRLDEARRDVEHAGQARSAGNADAACR